MHNLIEALRIFAKYTNAYAPCYCEHDTFGVCVAVVSVSVDDVRRLEELSFFPDEYGEGFHSYRYGSC
jgi:hypothetical protein